jgi:hypothetical protein
MEPSTVKAIAETVVSVVQSAVVCFGLYQARTAFDSWMQHRKGPMFPRATIEENAIDTRRRLA